MSKYKFQYKIIPLILIISIFFTSCDVPDISDFSEQSAEMTRGIKQGLKETDTILADASKRSDLFNNGQIEKIKKQLTEYRKNTKISAKSLESIDAYLEALNGLAAANKKSGDNAKAVVTAVDGLVSAVSGIAIADGAIRVATGLVTLVEKFRTAKAFKERVELVDQIMNGGDATGKPCIQDPHGTITKKVRNEIDLIDNNVRQRRQALENTLRQTINNLDATINRLEIEKSRAVTEQKKAELTAKISEKTAEKEDAESDTENEIFELYTRRAATLTAPQKQRIENAIGGLQCGVIDLLKFNVEDLRIIHNSVSKTLHTQTKIKHRTILNYHDSIVAEDNRVQKTLQQILDYKAKTVLYNDLTRYGENTGELKVALKDTLNGIFMTDSGLKLLICGIVVCNANVVNEDDFVRNFDSTYKEPVFNAFRPREAQLLDLNKRYTSDLERINPAYSAVIAELKQIKDKQKQMDNLFQTSGEALDTWAETHSNLRLTLNTKKPLTVSRLISKVKEIWSILQPETTE